MAKLQEWKNCCCNPFNHVRHNVKRTLLRPVSKSICERFPSILPGDKVCDSCRKKLAKVNDLPKKQVEQPHLDQPHLDQLEDSLRSLDFSTLSNKSASSPVSE